MSRVYCHERNNVQPAGFVASNSAPGGGRAGGKYTHTKIGSDSLVSCVYLIPKLPR